MDSASLEKLCRLIRYYILTITTQAGSGHPTSSLSSVEVMATLFFSFLRYDLDNPRNPANDRVIFSKGHATPLYYALYGAAGAISESELLTYRTFDSVLEGHPTERFKYTEAATGSLGQGLSIGVGEAVALRTLGQTQAHVYVLSGDGELAEGSVWEAASSASFLKLNSLVLIADINGLGQSDPTMFGKQVKEYQSRFESFGWHVVVIEDGNDLTQVVKAYQSVFSEKTRPSVILATTKKGKGVSFLEDASGWHGKPLSKEELPRAIGELGKIDTAMRGIVQKPLGMPLPQEQKAAGVPEPLYDPSKPVATRKAFGNALARLGREHPRLIVLDGDVKNSTYTEFFAKDFPDRFYELFIAEQHMAGVAVGFSARGFHPVVSSFACFLTRAADQIRMAAFSDANIIFNGSHAGVSIGEDGPSQMGLEDLALFRVVHGSTVLYPSDPWSTERLVEDALDNKGIVYIRTTRPETPVLYTANDTFPTGGSKTHSSSKKEVVTVVAAGITLHAALTAQKQLEGEGIGIRVIDAYSVKPIDQAALLKAAKETKGMIVVEDHYPEGGLGDAVRTALMGESSSAFVHLAVTKTPRSGKSTQLLAYEGIDAPGIVSAVQHMLHP